MITLAWFQPANNFQVLKDMGITTMVGPEIGTPPITDQAKWSKAAADLGLSVILKHPVDPLPPNCIGLMLTKDEPNRLGIPPAQLKPEYDDFKHRYPNLPVWLSLAGGNITSANFDKPAEKQLYADYAAVCDILTTNWYAKNRNANRYPLSFTRDSINKLRQVTTKPIYAWIECNDQNLDTPPAPDINRMPTPDEISQTVGFIDPSGNSTNKADGIGWFTTCQKGTYGWPQSYLPTVDRIGVSTAPQYAKVKEINASLNPVPPQQTLEQRVTTLEADMQTVKAVLGAQSSAIKALQMANNLTTGEVEKLQDWARNLGYKP